MVLEIRLRGTVVVLSERGCHATFESTLDRRGRRSGRGRHRPRRSLFGRRRWWWLGLLAGTADLPWSSANAMPGGRSSRARRRRARFCNATRVRRDINRAGSVALARNAATRQETHPGEEGGPALPHACLAWKPHLLDPRANSACRGLGRWLGSRGATPLRAVAPARCRTRS